MGGGGGGGGGRGHGWVILRDVMGSLRYSTVNSYEVQLRRVTVCVISCCIQVVDNCQRFMWCGPTRG